MIIIAASVFVYLLASKYDILEAIVTFTRRHEKWELDEFITVLVFLSFALSVFSLRRWHEAAVFQGVLSRRNSELETALAEINQLRGILPICSSCKQIRDDKGYWHRVDYYISQHSDATFTHSICPDCAKELYPELFDSQGQK